MQPLDPRLGKIKDIGAGALMEDGSPVLIVDVEDLIRSMDKLVAERPPGKTLERGAAARRQKRRKRVLVVDDSLTVRELERKLLGNRGYEVEVAVDGMDGWNAVRTGPLRPGRHRRRHAAHGRHRAGDADQEGPRAAASCRS